VRTNVKRATVVLALTPLFSVPAAVAFAGDVSTDTTTTTNTTTPAPDGTASATALKIDGIITAGQTTATAGSSGGSSSADALDLLGTRVAGGDQNGTGTNSGNIFGTGDTPLGDLEVAPWSTSVGSTGGTTQSAAEAALLHANLQSVAEVWLLHSQSQASWNQDHSTGDSQSDAAEVSAFGQLDIKVLHSEAHSDGSGSSDILVVNGQNVVSSSDVNGQCVIDASPLLVLNCLTATGGASGAITSAESDVATVDLGQGSLTGTVVGSKSQGSSAAPSQPQSGGGGNDNGGKVPGLGNGGNNGGAGNNNGGSVSGALPFTGSDAGRMTAIAAALAALGSTMVAFARRRRSGATLAH
jgi:hypothetical protein